MLHVQFISLLNQFHVGEASFQVHSYEPNFMYACHVERCPHAFMLGSTYSSLSHATRNHPNWKELLDQAPPITRPKLNQSPNSSASFLECESYGEIESNNDQQDDSNDSMDFSTPEWPTDSSLMALVMLEKLQESFCLD